MSIVPMSYLSSRIVTALLWLCWTFFATAPLYGQDQTVAESAEPPISTDRPAITGSSTVAPQGSVLMENGFTETSSKGNPAFDLSETLLRWGLTSKTELRFNAPDYFYNLDTRAGLVSGWGDITVGVRQQLLATSSGLNVVLAAFLSIPAGSNNLSSHDYDPQLLLPWSLPAFRHWSVAGMFALSWPTQGAARNLTGQPTFVLGRQITSRWDAFIEYAGVFPQQGSPQHLLHAGTTFKVTSNQQLDFHSGIGLSAAAVHHFIGFGYSFRFHHGHGKRHS